MIGVGDEVLTALFVWAAFAIFVFALIWRSRAQNAVAAVPVPEAVRVGAQEVRAHEPPAPPRAFDPAAECPICLEPPRAPCMTNCGHEFCTPCVMQYWNASFAPGQFRCPMCRASVDMIHMGFDPATPVANPEAGQAPDVRVTAAADIRAYNQRFSAGARTVVGMVRDTPVLLVQFFRHPTWLPATLRMTILVRMAMALAGGLIYALLPLDLIPESIVGVVGFLDDFFFVLFLFVVIANSIRTAILRNELAQ